MNRLRQWWKPALAALLTALALQTSASLLVRSARARSFLTRQLESSFGRSVEVEKYSASLFPTPQLDAQGVTVSEDTAFGHEYFLRAERLSAGLRWTGLLRGRIELGTLDLERPSLILVRNSEGRWNLEEWLPAAAPPHENSGAAATRAASQTHQLRRIVISNGRMNFKTGDEKLPFAFVQVEGAVEQIAPARWRLDLEAQPWRSGVPLQLAGTVRVSGTVAGTSARLQPAHLQLSWERSSLADIFRLIGGQDFGVRGTFAGEATADSGGEASSATKKLVPGDWVFSVQARASGIHRWDLTERSDNPRIGFRIKGRWNPGAGTTNADEVVIETPRSNFRGSAVLQRVRESRFEIRIDSSGLAAADLLDWYRAFRPGVAEGLRAEQYFTGAVVLSGWPVTFDEVAFSSSPGRWTVPGFDTPLEIKPLRGGTQRGKLVVEPFAANFVTSKLSGATKGPAAAKLVASPSGSVNFSVVHDLQQQSGGIRIEGQAVQAASVLAVLSAFGRNPRSGWDLKGMAGGDLSWEWSPGKAASWNGRADLTQAALQVAGLNQPVQLENLRAEWRGGHRKFTLNEVGAFGASWSGTVEQTGAIAAGAGEKDIPVWAFQLRADHLDAAELDRWIGPRARPNWLQRLLPAQLGVGSSAPTALLLKRIHASGDLGVDEVSVEKIRMKQFRAQVSLDGPQLKLQNAQAQWSGGTAQGSFTATLSTNATYEVSASLNGVSLAQTPWLARLSDHLAASVSGTVKLRAKGIGREALLNSLSGEGELRLSKVELRGWDVPGTMAQGQWKPGISRWPSGIGTFHLSDGGFELNALKLASASDEFLLKGSVSFSQDADLTAESHSTGRAARQEPSRTRFLTISGPLTEPKVSLEKVTTQQPGD